MSEHAAQSSSSLSEFWVPNLDSDTAAVLTVPTHLTYHEAVRQKLIRLLDAAGQYNTRVAIEHLDLEETQIQPEDFPEGWADQILACGIVKKIVLTGSPEAVAPADDDLARSAVEKQAALTLDNFVAVVLKPTGNSPFGRAKLAENRPV